MKIGKAPVPLAPKPIEVFEFVHPKVVPAVVLVNVVEGTELPAH
ncbi:MAG: hypothetical protein ACK476_08975 [Fluviicola sp.]